MKYLLIVLSLFSGELSAEIYKWSDSSGKVHYGDSPVSGQNAEKLAIEKNSNDLNGVTGSSKSLKQVIMYATTWCPYCKKARDHFRNNHIDYVEYDIEKDDSAKLRYDSLGGRGVPVILVGNKRMNGFSVSRFNELYE